MLLRSSGRSRFGSERAAAGARAEHMATRRSEPDTTRNLKPARAALVLRALLRLVACSLCLLPRPRRPFPLCNPPFNASEPSLFADHLPVPILCRPFEKAEDQTSTVLTRSLPPPTEARRRPAHNQLRRLCVKSTRDNRVSAPTKNKQQKGTHLHPTLRCV